MRFPFALLALPLPACATLPTLSSPVGLEQTQRVGALRVTPLSVVEDSRCPENARCVWAGRAVVRTKIEANGERLERNMTLGEPAEIAGRLLMLDSVTPGRPAGTTASVAPYRFHFALVEPQG